MAGVDPAAPLLTQRVTEAARSAKESSGRLEVIGFLRINLAYLRTKALVPAVLDCRIATLKSVPGLMLNQGPNRPEGKSRSVIRSPLRKSEVLAAFWLPLE